MERGGGRRPGRLVDRMGTTRAGPVMAKMGLPGPMTGPLGVKGAIITGAGVCAPIDSPRIQYPKVRSVAGTFSCLSSRIKTLKFSINNNTAHILIVLRSFSPWPRSSSKRSYLVEGYGRSLTHRFLNMISISNKPQQPNHQSRCCGK